MKKTVLIIGPAHPLRGGLASFDERLARAFTSREWQAQIYTFSLQYPGFLFPGTTQYSSEPPPDDIDIKVCINAVNPVNWLIMGKRLQRLSPDLVVVRYWLPFMGPCLGTLLRFIKKNKHTRVLCIADNVIPHEKRPGDTLFTRYFLKPVDAFITMSEKVLLDLKQFDTGKPATYIPHPIYDNFGEKVPKETARAKLELRQEDKIVLFFGFIRKYKGLDILLDAMKIIKERAVQQGRVPVRLLIAGEFYEDETPYLHQVIKNGIADNVILHTRFIPDSEVKYYLCASDVVVQPYRNATQSGVTPLAYHFEIPMIVTDVGSLASMVVDGRTGLVAHPDAHSIAEKIEQFFTIGSSYFVPALQEEKKKYTWTRLTDAIIQSAGL